MDKVYQFLYCDCIYESSHLTMSLHKTKKGAYQAMRKYIIKNYTDWYDERILWGKDRKSSIKFGTHENWCVKEITLEN